MYIGLLRARRLGLLEAMQEIYKLAIEPDRGNWAD